MMQRTDVKIGDTFLCGDERWMITDIGTRTVMAIPVRDGWMNGPPYHQAEVVFDENDLPGCDVA